MKTAVIYWSGTGNTEAMAHAVAEGMTAAGVEAVLLTPAEVQPGDLNTYDAIAFSCAANSSGLSNFCSPLIRFTKLTSKSWS